MKFRYFLPALLLALAACQPPSSTLQTRGIGVYPGNPAECAAPTLVPGGDTYRNIALHRAAYHSSSCDYNLTAQLVTDGILPDGPAPWTGLAVNGEEIPLRECHYLIDQNVSKVVRKGSEVTFRLDFAGYDVEADRVLVAGDAPAGTVVSLEGSSDGASWTPLGSGQGVPCKDWVGENDLIKHNYEWILQLPAAVAYSHFLLRVTPPGESEVAINELFFYRNGALIDVLPNARFSSSWRSRGAADEWVSVDLGTRSVFDRMVFHWLNAPVSGRIQVSDDGKRWKDVKVVAEGEDFSDISFARAHGRYVRVKMDASADGQPFELGEWEVWGRGGTIALPACGWKLKRLAAEDPSGEEISAAGFDDAQWMAATVPGTVLGSYVNAGAVPDPNYADNQLFISDSYFRSDFWYRGVLEAAPSKSERQFLHFGGVNFQAAVWLNGQYVGAVDGAFREKSFDVTGLLNEGDNYLAVRIFHNPHYGTVKEQNAYTPDGNGGVLGGDNPTMHATIGWDWIPTVRGRSIGIYDEVSLVYTGPVTVEDPFVRAELPLPDTTRATLFAEARVVNHSDRLVSGVLRWTFGEDAFEKEAALQPGSAETIRFDAWELDHPRLWWPRGYGNPELYDVSFVFTADGAVSDSTAFRTGVRQMTHQLEPYTPLTYSVFVDRNRNQRLSLYVNGRRFIGFGGNWGFPEHLLNYRSREYDIAVGYHADMNFTMIRNWVGMTDNRAFYEACDRHGVMIWQDFWLANPWDGPDPVDPDRFNAIAEEYVRRIRNHPSVALYVGRNEGYPPEVIDRFLDEMVGREHPGMCYIPHSSADGVSGGGPYHALSPQDYYTLYGKDKMHSERGMPNVMNYENLVRAIGAEHVEPYNSVAHPNAMYGLHDYTLGREGYHAAQQAESFNEILEKAFGTPADAKEFTRLAQWVNYNGYRAMFEGRSEFRRGLILWMSHPAWPSMVWQTYDYYFEPTGAYFGCKKACEPVHILLNPLDSTVAVVNYRAGDLSGLTASATVYDLDGKPVLDQADGLDVAEDETRVCFTLAVPETISEVYFVRLKLTGADGALLSENFYTLGKEAGNLRALRSLSVARVTVSAAGGPDAFEVTLTNRGKAPVPMVRLKALDSKTGDLVLPVWYSDNYMALMPGESRTVTVCVRAEDRRGRLRFEAEPLI